jgi:hypothetical protein
MKLLPRKEQVTVNGPKYDSIKGWPLILTIVSNSKLDGCDGALILFPKQYWYSSMSPLIFFPSKIPGTFSSSAGMLTVAISSWTSLNQCGGLRVGEVIAWVWTSRGTTTNLYIGTYEHRQNMVCKAFQIHASLLLWMRQGYQRRGQANHQVNQPHSKRKPPCCYECGKSISAEGKQINRRISLGLHACLPLHNNKKYMIRNHIISYKYFPK